MNSPNSTMPKILTANTSESELVSSFLGAYRKQSPLIPSNLPTACLLEGRKARTVADLLLNFDDQEVFVYWDQGTALRRESFRVVSKFWATREPWEDYDFCVFPRSLDWCIGFTHNAYCVLVTRQKIAEPAGCTERRDRVSVDNRTQSVRPAWSGTLDSFARMRQGITFLILWLIIAVLLGGVFVPVVPPGGVSWPYYLFVASVPVGALLYACFPGRVLVAVCYGLLAGVWFSLPIFDDRRAVLAGAITGESVTLRVGLFAVAMTLVCSGAFVVGQRLFRRDEVDDV
jgi:hypothetical protein